MILVSKVYFYLYFTVASLVYQVGEPEINVSLQEHTFTMNNLANYLLFTYRNFIRDVKR